MRSSQDRAIIAAKVPALVAVKLDSWAAWMRSGAGARGYPSRSCGMASGGIHSSDDAEMQADSYAARACDGAINSLTTAQISAIGVYWLGYAPPAPPDVLFGLVVDALPIIHRGLIQRGCM